MTAWAKAHPTDLAVGSGNPEDFLNLLNTMGQFKIDKVIVEKEK